MDIKELQQTWHEFGRQDPLWAILTHPDKKGNRWELDEFFKTGVKDVEAIIKYVMLLDSDFKRITALDFGCGVGRLTQALAGHFDFVYGVDIAPSMIDLAKNYNRHGDKCKYRLNEADDLRIFADNTFHFILSLLVLQHMEPRYTKAYIREFLRVLAPKGVITFTLPSEPISRVPSRRSCKILREKIRTLVPKPFLSLYRNIRHGSQSRGQPKPNMEMHGIRREELERFLRENGAIILDTTRDCRDDPHWVIYRYCVTKA